MKLPDYITSLNLVAGLLAIFAAMHQHTAIAGILIFAGVIFDAADGYVARKMGIESDFGAELDSLADLVTFGVAPMILVMNLFPYSGTKMYWLFYLAMLLPLCGALRLARHNINRHQTKGFLIGVPITFTGLAVPVLALFSVSETVWAGAIILLAIGMLSTLRVNKLFK